VTAVVHLFASVPTLATGTCPDSYLTEEVVEKLAFLEFIQELLNSKVG